MPCEKLFCTRHFVTWSTCQAVLFAWQILSGNHPNNSCLVYQCLSVCLSVWVAVCVCLSCCLFVHLSVLPEISLSSSVDISFSYLRTMSELINMLFKAENNFTIYMYLFPMPLLSRSFRQRRNFYSLNIDTVKF